MPGVFRPYTLVDVLGTINGQSQDVPDTTVNGVGYYAEADESMEIGDSATTYLQTAQAWDQGQWGSIGWS